jgi:hypothetical protein
MATKVAEVGEAGEHGVNSMKGAFWTDQTRSPYLVARPSASIGKAAPNHRVGCAHRLFPGPTRGTNHREERFKGILGIGF